MAVDRVTGLFWCWRVSGEASVDVNFYTRAAGLCARNARAADEEAAMGGKGVGEWREMGWGGRDVSSWSGSVCGLGWVGVGDNDGLGPILSCPVLSQRRGWRAQARGWGGAYVITQSSCTLTCYVFPSLHFHFHFHSHPHSTARMLISPWKTAVRTLAGFSSSIPHTVFLRNGFDGKRLQPYCGTYIAVLYCVGYKVYHHRL